jgi:AbrB family looped-hinge helix DNA binding protein
MEDAPMQMKVFNKGQVVIPAPIRRALGIQIGEMLDVRVDERRERTEISKPASGEARSLAGSLAQYGRGRARPSRAQMNAALAKGLAHER